ncbi:MAG: hypothetical protein ACRDMX_08320, partial [Solirubrobacteraceae bacterium]
MLSTASYVYAQVTSQGWPISLDFQLISPQSGADACGGPCVVGEGVTYGPLPAGSSLVFELYGWAFGQKDISAASNTNYDEVAQITPNEWTIGYEGGTINVYALSVSAASTLGSAPTGLGNYPQCSTARPVNCATG